MKTHRHIALLLAGGSGSRMNAPKPKQYIQVDGESILLHTMRAFQRHPLIKDIYVVCALDWENTVREEAAAGNISKFRDTIIGGETSYDSLRNGVKSLQQNIKEQDAIILVHDAVRPLITQDIISRNIAVCLTNGNAITAMNSHEAYILSEDNKQSDGYMPREGLLRAQTPHTFPLKTLTEIISNAEIAGIHKSQSLFTLANELGIQPLYIAQGDLLNFKLTIPSDILIYQALKDIEG